MRGLMAVSWKAWHTLAMDKQANIEIGTLSAEERLTLLERIWDSLRETPDLVPLTANQRRELDRRLDEMDSGDTSGVPLEDAIQRIRQRKN